MRFYAVCTEAIEHTHRALQQLEQRRRGSSRPSRALRVAQLYGHLQCRARGGAVVQLGLRDLAAAWHLQPRELRADLQDLQAIGWLHYSGGPAGMQIRLTDATLVAADGASQESNDLVNEAASLGPSEPTAGPAPSQVEPDLIAQFAEHYNRQRPSSWPAYSPRGSALSARLRRAIAHAGDAETFWPVLAQALTEMPEFWRRTYPQGRSGADCAAALFSGDRQAAGLGVEFWHVFCWSGGRGLVAGDGAPAAQGSAPGPGESDLDRARRLLYWAGNHWRGTGIEAAKLERSDKRRLAELLEAAGVGVAGVAAEQFSRPAQTY